MQNGGLSPEVSADDAPNCETRILDAILTRSVRDDADTSSAPSPISDAEFPCLGGNPLGETEVLANTSRAAAPFISGDSPTCGGNEQPCQTAPLTAPLTPEHSPKSEDAPHETPSSSPTTTSAAPHTRADDIGEFHSATASQGDLPSELVPLTPADHVTDEVPPVTVCDGILSDVTPVPCSATCNLALTESGSTTSANAPPSDVEPGRHSHSKSPNNLPSTVAVPLGEQLFKFLCSAFAFYTRPDDTEAALTVMAQRLKRLVRRWAKESGFLSLVAFYADCGVSAAGNFSATVEHIESLFRASLSDARLEPIHRSPDHFVRTHLHILENNMQRCPCRYLTEGIASLEANSVSFHGNVLNLTLTYPQGKMRYVTHWAMFDAWKVYSTEYNVSIKGEPQALATILDLYLNHPSNEQFDVEWWEDNHRTLLEELTSNTPARVYTEHNLIEDAELDYCMNLRTVAEEVFLHIKSLMLKEMYSAAERKTHPVVACSPTQVKKQPNAGASVRQTMESTRSFNSELKKLLRMLVPHAIYRDMADKEGFFSVKDVHQWLTVQSKGTLTMTEDDLVNFATNAERRIFHISSDRMKIRANYGHRGDTNFFNFSSKLYSRYKKRFLPPAPVCTFIVDKKNVVEHSHIPGSLIVKIQRQDCFLNFSSEKSVGVPSGDACIQFEIQDWINKRKGRGLLIGIAEGTDDSRYPDPIWLLSSESLSGQCVVLEEEFCRIWDKAAGEFVSLSAVILKRPIPPSLPVMNQYESIFQGWRQSPQKEGRRAVRELEEYIRSMSESDSQIFGVLYRMDWCILHVILSHVEVSLESAGAKTTQILQVAADWIIETTIRQGSQAEQEILTKELEDLRCIDAEDHGNLLDIFKILHAQKFEDFKLFPESTVRIALPGLHIDGRKDAIKTIKAVAKSHDYTMVKEYGSFAVLQDDRMSNALQHYADALSINLNQTPTLRKSLMNASTMGCYERSEFLGDALLDYLVAHDVYVLYTETGVDWSCAQHSTVRNKQLMALMDNIGVSNLELFSGFARGKRFADLFEATLCVIYEELGLECSHKYLREWMSVKFQDRAFTKRSLCDSQGSIVWAIAIDDKGEDMRNFYFTSEWQRVPLGVGLINYKGQLQFAPLTSSCQREEATLDEMEVCLTAPSPPAIQEVASPQPSAGQATCPPSPIALYSQHSASESANHQPIASLPPDTEQNILQHEPELELLHEPVGQTDTQNVDANEAELPVWTPPVCMENPLLSNEGDTRSLEKLKAMKVRALSFDWENAESKGVKSSLTSWVRNCEWGTLEKYLEPLPRKWVGSSYQDMASAALDEVLNPLPTHLHYSVRRLIKEKRFRMWVGEKHWSLPYQLIGHCVTAIVALSPTWRVLYVREENDELPPEFPTFETDIHSLQPVVVLSVTELRRSIEVLHGSGQWLIVHCLPAMDITQFPSLRLHSDLVKPPRNDFNLHEFSAKLRKQIVRMTNIEASHEIPLPECQIALFFQFHMAVYLLRTPPDARIQASYELPLNIYDFPFNLYRHLLASNTEAYENGEIADYALFHKEGTSSRELHNMTRDAVDYARVPAERFAFLTNSIFKNSERDFPLRRAIRRLSMMVTLWTTRSLIPPAPVSDRVECLDLVMDLWVFWQ